MLMQAILIKCSGLGMSVGVGGIEEEEGREEEGGGGRREEREETGKLWVLPHLFAVTQELPFVPKRLLR